MPQNLKPGEWTGVPELEALRPGEDPDNGIFVVGEGCIKCKYQDCVEYCPTDAFYEGVSMVVIQPDDCINCDACVPQCSLGAIYRAKPDSKIAKLNREYASKWPNITQKGLVPADAERWATKTNKLRLFDPRPAPLRQPTKPLDGLD